MEKTAKKTTAKKVSIVSNSLTKNVVQFRNGFINLPNSGENNREMAMSVVSELMQFGYLPTADAMNHLAAASKEDIVAFHNEVISYLKDFTGSNKNYRPFWKNFPQDTIDRTNSELLFHMVVNYWTSGSYEPNDFSKERPTAFEHPKYKTVEAGDNARFEKIFTDLVSVNQSLTPDDMGIIKWFVNSGTELRFPEQIPFKENLCTLAAMGLDVPVKTVTDVLRIAVGMSGGDISLPKVPRKVIKVGRYSYARNSENPKRAEFKFKNFKRSERRLLLSLLEKTNCDATEAVLKDQRWIRLGELVHPGEYKTKYPKAAAMFDAIRNKKVQSWYGKVNAAFKESFEKGVNTLAERPGEFMRRLDWLVRSNGAERRELVLSVLERIAPKVSNKVLFEAYTHFEKRLEPNDARTIMIKGSRKRTVLPKLEALSEYLVRTVQGGILDALKAKFSALPAMEKVWIDEELQKIPLPFNMRSMNSALKPVIRGSRLPWDNKEAKVIRAFLRFEKDNNGITIDLSAVLIGRKNDKPFNDIVSWNHQKHGKDIVIHSGDSFGRIGACAEYIDIDVQKSLDAGFKYVLVQLHNWNQAPALYENNHFGVMERNFPKANKVWLPSTIANCSIVRVENIVNCAIIDLTTGEYIMVDEDASRGSGAWINMANTLDFKAVEAYIKPPKISVYDLLKWHVDARGGQIVEKHETKEYFSFEDFSQSYVEILKFMGV